VPAKRAPVAPPRTTTDGNGSARPPSSRSRPSRPSTTADERRHPRQSSRAAPILVRVVRNGIEESVHRGHVVETDAEGRILRLLGDPDRLVTLRSTVKPFGATALIDAGGIEAFDLTAPEIAIMASSHSGEDVHVRTLQALFRRARVSQTSLACGAEKMPLDALTAARLARDGERAGPIRHMCSGQHAVFLLMCRLRDWEEDGYWLEDHPAQVVYREAVARAFATRPDRLRLAIDGCGIPTYAFPIRDVARAYATLAEPAAVAANDPRRPLAHSLTVVRDAMLAHPELVGGNRDRLDTSVMKAAPGRLVSKAGMEALRGVAILRGPRDGASAGAEATPVAASGLAVKIEDGDGYDRGTWSASIEALRQAGALSESALRQLTRYHRPVDVDPHGRVSAESISDFDLAPVGELIG
jgi:L-asparaginase II